MFYAYNWPKGSSSNTGFETYEKDLLYFLVGYIAYDHIWLDKN